MVGVFLVVRFALRCRLLFGGIVIIKSGRTSDPGMYEETVLAKPWTILYVLGIFPIDTATEIVG